MQDRNKFLSLRIKIEHVLEIDMFLLSIVLSVTVKVTCFQVKPFLNIWCLCLINVLPSNM